VSGEEAAGWSFATLDAPPQVRTAPRRGLSGDLQTLPPGDLLQWLAGRAKNGTLHCGRRSTRKMLVFEQGVLRACSSNDPRETLGQLLLREQLLAEEELFRALERQRREPGSLLGRLLVSQGLINETQLQRALVAKAEETVYELFLWPDGGFFFEEDKRPGGLPDGVQLDAQAVVQEGNRRRARWRRIEQAFPAGDLRFRAICDTPPPAESLKRRMLELALTGKSLARISLELRQSEFTVAEYLHALCELKVLAAERAPGESLEGDAIATIEGLRARAQEALQQGRGDQAFHSYEQVLALDPLNRPAREGLVAASDARKQQRRA
jgi:hypothetical protein